MNTIPPGDAKTGEILLCQTEGIANARKPAERPIKKQMKGVA